jgi:hypothetical protein
MCMTCSAVMGDAGNRGKEEAFVHRLPTQAAGQQGHNSRAGASFGAGRVGALRGEPARFAACLSRLEEPKTTEEVKRL